tara:strand:- start:301 stop:1248 length:948 start_codon:yes stop_codon:yes gene_type:complete
MAKFKWYGQDIFNFKTTLANVSDISIEKSITTTVAEFEPVRFENAITSANTITAELGLVGAINTASQTNITGLGTITTGVWNGTAIASTYMSSATTSAQGAVELATTAETTTGTDTSRAVTPDGLKDGYQGSTNVVTLGSITTGVWRGTSINTTYTDAKVTSIVAGSGVGVSGATGDVTVSASHTQIKILPHHFMSNEDGGANKSAQFRDDTIIGVRATHNDAELYAFVEIPVGHTATSVTVYGNDTGLDVLVYESDINAGALTDKTHASGCSVGSACDITDVVADGTNYLVVKVAIASYTNDIVYGGTVTLTAS